MLYYHSFKCQIHLEAVKFDVAPMRIGYRVSYWGRSQFLIFTQWRPAPNDALADA
jgi:hypothetical protein